MDPKVREILNRVKESAFGAGKAAGKFAGDVVSQAKLSLQIFDLGTEVDVCYKEIGKLVYAVHKGEEVCNEAIQAQIDSIDSKNAQIAELRAHLAAMRNAPTCPSCGREVSRSDVFCSFCGARLDAEEAEASEAAPEDAGNCGCSGESDGENDAESEESADDTENKES